MLKDIFSKISKQPASAAAASAVAPLAAQPVKLHFRHTIVRQHQDESQHVGIIILHDFASACGAVRPLVNGISALPAARVKLAVPLEVFTPDLRSHGRSPRDAQVSAEAHVADIARFCSTVVEPEMPLHLIGVGWGAVIAAGAAVAAPARFSSLSMLGALPLAANASARAAALLRLELAQRYSGGFASLEELDARLKAEVVAEDARRQLMQGAGCVGDRFAWLADVERLSQQIDSAFSLPPSLRGGAAQFTGPALLLVDEDVSAAEEEAARALLPRLTVQRSATSVTAPTHDAAVSLALQVLAQCGLACAAEGDAPGPRS